MGAILPAGRYGDGSALVVFLASIRCFVWGHSDPHAGRIEATDESDLDGIASGRENDGNRRSQLLGDQY